MRTRLHGLRVRRGFAGLAASALCAALHLAAGCAKGPAPEVLAPSSVRVRIGPIEPSALDAALKSAPRKLSLRTEHLVDLLWQAGCLGESMELPLRSYAAANPDVVCSLPGRTQHHIVVVAHLDGDVDEGERPPHWSGIALLPFLYRTLAVEAREHTFVFAAFGRSPRRSARDYLSRLGEPFGEDVRAIVDLQQLDPAQIWFSSSDAGLRRDLLASSLAVQRPLESLRSFAPGAREPGLRIPSIVIAARPPPRATRSGRDRQALPAVDAQQADTPASFHAAARLLAVYLGYLDETLRLRAEPQLPAEPAEPEPR